MTRALAAAVALAATLAACGGVATRTPSASTAASYPTTTGRTSTAGASDVRIPAMFTIESGGKLSPPTVIAPAGVRIELTVVSSDGRAHRVVVGGEALTVPAGAPVSTTLSGLPRGPHVLVVDGVPRGALIVGGQPGP